MARPLHLNGIVTATPKHFQFVEGKNPKRQEGRTPQRIKEMGIRNVGVNTLYLSFNRGRDWVDVASGTSFGAEMDVDSFMAKTTFGQTYFTAIAAKHQGGAGSVDFTHYPKLEKNLVHSAYWRGEGDIRNTMGVPLGPGETITGFASAINFTRFYGSIFADQPLQLVLSFGNDEDHALPDPRYPDTEELQDLTDPADAHYDVVAQEVMSEGGAGEGFFCIIYGKWLKIEITNTGDEPVKVLRCFTRASVF
jgi:hypothetical protein